MKISNEVRIGILGVAALVVFFMGYNYLKGKGMFTTKKTISAIYPKVEGLKTANRISLNGFDIGTVTDMYVTDGDINKGITVEMAVDKGINIPKDSKAIITSDGLLGGKSVKFELGKSKDLIAGGGMISGDIEYGLMDKASSEVDVVINDLKHSITSLDTALSGMKNILNQGTQQNIKSAIFNLNTTTSEFAALSRTLGSQKGTIDKTMSSMNATASNLNAFSNNLNKNNGTITRTMNNLETTTNNFSKIQLEQTVAKLDKTLNSLQSTLGKVSTGNGSMALLMNDDKLYKNIKNTSATLNNLLYDLSARPHRYVNLNLFGGRKKTSPPLKAPNADK